MSTNNPGPPDQSGGSDQSPWTPPDPGAGWTPPADPNAGATPADSAPDAPQVFGAGGHPVGQSRPGKMARQEPGVTQPRPPTVGEARARDKARKQAEEAERAAAAAAEAKRRNRKRVMIGGVAIVGVAALVGGGYLVYSAVTAPDQVTASCVQIDQNGQEVVVADEFCGDGKSNFRSDGGGGLGGLVILGWPQYRYHYGGTPTIGKAPTGGSSVKPRNAEVKTKSGTTVQRGGLGSKSTGGSGS
ncbi:hypothetical protein [Nocardia lasii]|uniref:Uncharacterized protein n=1 Tax=Nocardia lasii TaxID=1616107 RepID=A0ABW1JV86_9NOCA